MKHKTYSLLAIFILFLFTNIYPVFSFSGAGPYTHLEITRLALDQFAKETGWEVTSSCAQVLMQYSVYNDSKKFAGIDEYHCDNNKIQACSHNFDRLLLLAEKTPVLPESLKKIGMAFHIVQDFYAHSNWAETAKISMVLAPFERFKDIPPPPNLQTGLYPENLSALHLEASFACFTAPEEMWDKYIYGATHACLNKDSNRTFRGAAYVNGNPFLTYHELAGRYAVKHTVKVLKHLKATNKTFALCLRPNVGFYGACNLIISRNSKL